jgi:hypothetical protein
MAANTQYQATEFNRATCEPTGRTETYFAGSLLAAVDSLLYTKRVSNGGAFIGPTGRCVYAGALSYAIVPVKSQKRRR